MLLMLPHFQIEPNILTDSFLRFGNDEVEILEISFAWALRVNDLVVGGEWTFEILGSK